MILKKILSIFLAIIVDGILAVCPSNYILIEGSTY